MNARYQNTVVSGDTGTRSNDAVWGYTFDQFVVDVRLQQFSRAGEVIPLTVKAFDLLLALLANRDRVLSKDELMNLVWPKTIVSENSLAQVISVLRRTLGDDLDHPHYIATVARRGYRFVGDVTELKHDRTVDTAETALKIVEPADTTHVSASVVAPVPEPMLPARASRSTRPIVWAGLAIAVLLVSVVFTVEYVAGLDSQVPAEPIWFTQDAPSGTRIVSTSALSPDGRYLAFVAQDDQTHRTQLWIRAFNTTAATPVNGSEGAVLPFWSPDSEAIAFFSDGKIKRIRLDQNLPQTIAGIDDLPQGGSWSTNGTILFSVLRSGIFSVPSAGGKIEPVTVLDQAAHEFAHRRPQFLPDGRRFLFDVDSTDPAHSGSYVASLDATQDKVRVSDRFATFASPGYLLIASDGVLVAQRFDTVQLQSLPGMMTIAEHVSSSPVSTSANNRLSFQAGTLTTRLRRYTRAGVMIDTVGGADGLRVPVLSRDGHELLVRGDGDRFGIWLVDLDRRTVHRLVDGSTAVWSPDGSQIAFVANRGGASSDIYTRPSSGTGEDHLLRTPSAATLMDWSPDGRFILYVTADPRTKRDIWALPLSGERKPVPLLQSPADEIAARISPDGRWVAYASDESGSWEVYVQSFPSLGFKRVISVGGGGQPTWSTDGRELFYLSPDHHVMAVDVIPGKTLEVGRPAALFQVPVFGAVDRLSQYSPLINGQQFIIDTIDPVSSADAITVVLNWDSTANRSYLNNPYGSR